MALLAANVMQANGAPAATRPVALTRAADVLERMRANLPNKSIQIKGELLCGMRRGKLDRAFYLQADLHLGQIPVAACYTLRDAFGTTTEQLTITRQPDGAWRRDYARGPLLQTAPAPTGENFIGNSDITWNDLSLAFLWWTGGIIAERELLLERECLILEFIPPSAPQLTRVWIDESLLMLIKIEEYDAQRVLQRRITVRTFKKIGDNWLIKDMDIRRWPGEHRTILRLNDVNVATNTPEIIGAR